MSENNALLGDLKVQGEGTFKLPPGMTQEEADRLVREAEEQRRKDS